MIRKALSDGPAPASKIVKGMGTTSAIAGASRPMPFALTLTNQQDSRATVDRKRVGSDMARFQITAEISGTGRVMHITKAFSLDLAKERIKRAYPGRVMQILRAERLK